MSQVIQMSNYRTGHRYPLDATRMHEDDIRRLGRYDRFWRFFRGDHWGSQNSQHDPNDPVVTYNISRRIVNLLVGYLLGEGNESFQLVIPDDPLTPENEAGDRAFIKGRLDNIWELNSKETLIGEIGQMASITGDAFVQVGVHRFPGEERDYPRFLLQPSHFCFPTIDPEDRNRMIEMKLQYPVYREGEAKRSKVGGRMSRFFKGASPERNKSMSVSIRTEVWTDTKVSIYIDDELIEEREHSAGELPFVHIKNMPIAGDFYGMSDLDDVTHLNREINEKWTDVSDIINYHGSPLTIVSGARLSQLEKGPNRMWALPEGAKIDNLTLDGDLKATMTFLEKLHDGIYELANLPPEARGGKGAAAITGAAKGMTFQPLLKLLRTKARYMAKGIEDLNRIALRMERILDVDFDAKMDDLSRPYRTKAVFPRFMPKDEQVELSLAEKKLTLGLTTKKNELEKMGHSTKEVDRLIEEGRRERQEMFADEFESYREPPKPKTGKGRGSTRPMPDAAGAKNHSKA